ncbi:MAG TPA: type VI secretion system tip protein TssI/VgrG [Acetobacteraceae bacterium]|nr:type VI secretion system tip protein TssI/VgrG [Acetobacteraceae bacterium]
MGDTQALAAGGLSQTDRLLAIDTKLGPDEALLINLEGEDVLSHCFVYNVTIETSQQDDAVQALLGTPVTLWLRNDDPDLRRPINGYVRQLIGQGETLHGMRRYRFEIVPRLWFLTCTSDCRIFQHQSIPDVIQTVLQDHGVTDFEFRVAKADYPPVEYCVQYRETAFAFVSRLMEHLGLFYWHEHHADRHVLVIADRNTATGRCQPAEVSISPVSGLGELQTLDVRCTFRPGRWTLNDFDFQGPSKRLTVDAPTTLSVALMANHEMYDYPGKFLDRDDGKRLTTLRIELEEAHHRQVFGVGRCVGFDPGRRFSVAVGRQGRATTYLLTAVYHHASAPGSDNDGAVASYSNDYVAIPADVPFRPERVTPWPRVIGIQTATVVGPAGETIHCDEYGRVRVQFHWDRRGQRDEHSSCWIRVSQHSAGYYWGAVSVPHVGHEVVVSFLEGDPDRPLISGRTHNSETMPPINLPDDKHKTVVRDHGDNKMVFHGKPGEEYVSMYTPRQFNTIVGFSGAKSLSAAAADSGSLAPGMNSSTGTSVPLKGQVSETLSGTSASGSVQSATATFDPFMDPTGFDEVINAASTIANGGTITDTFDANTAVAGRMNSLCVGNDNTWCGGNYNEWVNQNYNFAVRQVAMTSIGMTNTTQVGVNNDLFVGGVNSTFVLGLNSAIAVGGNFSLVLGAANIGIVISPNVAVSLAGKASLTFPDDMTAATTRISALESDVTAAQDDITAVQNKIKVAENDIEAIDNDLDMAFTRIKTVNTDISTIVTELKDHEIDITL